MLPELQEKLPNGFEILKAESVPINQRSLSQMLKSATWSFEIKEMNKDPSTKHFRGPRINQKDKGEKMLQNLQV